MTDHVLRATVSVRRRPAPGTRSQMSDNGMAGTSPPTREGGHQCPHRAAHSLRPATRRSGVRPEARERSRSCRSSRGTVVLATAAVALTQGSTAPLTASGGTGHPAPVTSAIERSLESGSSTAVVVAGTSAAAIQPLTVTVESAATGLAARVPAASSAMEQAIASQARAALAPPTLVVAAGDGRNARVPSASSPMEQAIASQAGVEIAAPTIVITSPSGFDHRLPVR